MKKVIILPILLFLVGCAGESVENDFIEDVDTDKYGQLKTICTQILQGQRPMNTHELGSNKLVQFHISSGGESNLKQVVVNTAQKQSSSMSLITRSETMIVRVDDGDRDKIGIVERRVREDKCIGSSSSSAIDQKNLGISSKNP